MSTRLKLFYASKLRNRICIYLLFCIVVSKEIFFSHGYPKIKDQSYISSALDMNNINIHIYKIIIYICTIQINELNKFLNK